MLYEPTNIIPSTFTQTGTVASSDNVEIQWQVNGNSALSMFQVDVLENSTDSELVYSTGVITPSQLGSLPFYGKDRLGNYVPFAYAPQSTWAAWSGGRITDGNSYKLKITQFYGQAGQTVKVALTSNTTEGTAYYFSAAYNGTTYYISFTAFNIQGSPFFESGDTVYFNLNNQIGWLRKGTGSQRVITDLSLSVTTTQPSGATLLNGAAVVGADDIFFNQIFIAQSGPSAFITRTNPTLVISEIQSPVESASVDFSASYSQAQGDGINSVRWQVISMSDQNAVVADTGIIYTPVLEYEYNGFFSGQQYKVICSVVTSNEVEVTSEVQFTVDYAEEVYEGNFAAQCVCDESANILQWDATMTSIPGNLSPANGGQIIDGVLNLNDGATVTWEQEISGEQTEAQLSFPAPWSVLCKTILPPRPDLVWGNSNYIGNITKSGTALGEVYCAAYSPDGKYLVLGGDFTGHASLFSVNGTSITYISDITINGAAINNNVKAAKFNSAGNLLILGGSFYNSGANNLAVFKFESGQLTFVGGSSQIAGPVNALSINKAGTLLVTMEIYYSSSSYKCVCRLHRISSSGTLQYISDIVDTTVANSGTGDVCFSPNGNVLAIALGAIPSSVEQKSYAKLYTVNGEAVSFVSDIGTTQNSATNGIAFSPDGNYIVLGGSFTYSLVLYSISGAESTFVKYIKLTDNEFTGFLTDTVYSVSYSPDGKKLIATCNGAAYSCDMNGAVTSLLSLIQRGATGFDSLCETAVFAPDYSGFIIGGQFTGGASVWSVDITPANNSRDINSIYALQQNNISLKATFEQLIIEQLSSSGSTQLGSINIPVFSPDGQVPNIIVTLLTPTALTAYFYLNETYLSSSTVSLSYAQSQISEVTITGQQECDYIAVISGNGQNISSELTDADFEPEWGNTQYSPYLLANFSSSLDGGQAAAEGVGFRVYRRDITAGTNAEIATLPAITLALKDYGIKSGTQYIYDFYAYDATGAFMGVKSSSPITQRFRAFSLLSTQYNSDDGCYHVEKEYRFSCNVQDMAVTNNSNKQYSQNFTPYPTVFRSTANYASGTLQALIGFVDKKYYKYWDSTALMSELRGLSTTTNTLFLKDKKGQIWMVDVGAVTLTATQKTREMQVTISLPWTEIGDAENVSIIQTPDDEAWNSASAQILDGTFDVEIGTGKLKAIYPYNRQTIAG